MSKVNKGQNIYLKMENIMKNNNCTNNLLWSLIFIVSFLITLFLAARYSYLWVGDADAANSPIVWRAFLEKGFSAFHEWKPTFDNWYFTVYPINFLLFFAFGSDGLAPLLLSSVIFIFVINICSTLIVKKESGSIIAIIAIVCLTFSSPDLYRNGYLSHPFSHNSTNAYGFVVFISYLYTKKKKNITPVILCSILSLMASISDPWFLPAFFLPMIITEIFYLKLTENKNEKINIVLYFITFTIAASNIIQKVLDLPTHEFSIASFSQIIENINNSIILSSKILPLYPYYGNLMAYISFLVWIVILIFSLYICVRSGGLSRIIAIFSTLSIAGIYASSIIGDQVPHQRFYLNITPMIVILLCISASKVKNKLTIIPLLIMLIISIITYTNHDITIKTKNNPVNDYMMFLSKNNLTYGYGSFWGMSMGVNWFSDGRIHITPVYFNSKTGEVNFKDVRVQTMKYWHTAEFIENKPPRQFIAISKGDSGDTCSDVSLCVNAVKSQIGKPDEILDYDDIKILIFNHPIPTGL